MKRGEQIKKFRGMDAGELRQTITSAREELMNFRFRKATGRLPSPALVHSLKRQIARAETILNEKNSQKN